MERQAFDGKVTLEVITHMTVRETIIRNGFQREIPEYVSFTGETKALFDNLILLLSRVKRFACDTEEQDPVVLEARRFWDFMRGNNNYRSIWDAYLDLPTLRINNEFMENGINPPSEEDQLRAPLEVRPGGPSDADLEGGGEEASAFLADGVNILKPSDSG